MNESLNFRAVQQPMCSLHDCVLGRIVGPFFGGDFQNNRVDLLSFIDQRLHELLAGVLCDQDDWNVRVLQEPLERCLHILFSGLLIHHQIVSLALYISLPNPSEQESSYSVLESTKMYLIANDCDQLVAFCFLYGFHLQFIMILNDLIIDTNYSICRSSEYQLLSYRW
jgi:hypothetical protein